MNTNGLAVTPLYDRGIFSESDSALLVGLQRGDPEAMANLFDRYGDLVYSLALRMVGTSGEAEEIAADVFVQVWKVADTIAGECQTLGPWLLQSARNRCIAHIEARLAGLPFAEHANCECGATADGFALQSDLAESAERVRLAFSSLSDQERTIVTYAYFAGVTQADLAERMQLPIAFVTTRATAAVTKFRESLKRPVLRVSQAANTR